MKHWTAIPPCDSFVDGGQLVSYLCGELIGGEIFLDSLESFGEYCEDDEVVEDPSAFEYLQTFEDAAILSETLSATFNYIIPEDDIDSVCQVQCQGHELYTT